MKNKGDGVQNKKLIILLSVLVGLIAILVVAILVVHNVILSNKKLTPEQWDEKYEMESLALSDCEDINQAFNGGMITNEEAGQYYEEMYEKTDSNFYKVRLTLCYADYMYNKNHDLDGTVKMLERIEPLIEDTDDYVDYYDRLIVYYVEADDWDKVMHYAELRDAMFPDGNEAIDDDLAADESDLVNEGQYIREAEIIDSNEKPSENENE